MGQPMKILRIIAQRFPSFKNLDICCYMQQRVCEEERDSLFCFWTNWEWGIRYNVTADDVESWWLTWWIAWWVSLSKLSWVCMREWKEDVVTLGE